MQSKEKGYYGGRCNLTACTHTDEPARWYNRGSRAYYCEADAQWLNRMNPEIMSDGRPMCVYDPDGDEPTRSYGARVIW